MALNLKLFYRGPVVQYQYILGSWPLLYFFLFSIATYTYWEADAATRDAVWPDSPELYCCMRSPTNNTMVIVTV